MKCDQCDSALEPAQRFCPNCGSSTSADAWSLGGSETEGSSGPDATLVESVPRGLAPGTVIDSRFEVQEVLGQGSFGLVCRVRDLQFPDVVKALKIPHAHLVGTSAFERFQQEMVILLRLNHQSIVPIRDTGKTADGRPYYTMDFCSGRTLSDVIQAEGPLAVPRFLQVARGVLDALEAAHGHGILHRDLKPGNIMLVTVRDTEHARVLDFGVGTFMDRSEAVFVTQEQGPIGSPGYMAPEQADPELGDVDERTDLYNAAATFFQALSGDLPIRGTWPRILHKILTEPPRSPSELRGEPLPEGMEAALFRGLAKAKEDRFDTSAEFLAALEEGARAPEIAPSQKDPEPLHVEGTLLEESGSPVREATREAARAARPAPEATPARAAASTAEAVPTPAPPREAPATDGGPERVPAGRSRQAYGVAAVALALLVTALTAFWIPGWWRSSPERVPGSGASASGPGTHPEGGEEGRGSAGGEETGGGANPAGEEGGQTGEGGGTAADLRSWSCPQLPGWSGGGGRHPDPVPESALALQLGGADAAGLWCATDSDARRPRADEEIPLRSGWNRIAVYSAERGGEPLWSLEVFHVAPGDPPAATDGQLAGAADEVYLGRGEGPLLTFADLPEQARIRASIRPPGATQPTELDLRRPWRLELADLDAREDGDYALALRLIGREGAGLGTPLERSFTLDRVAPKVEVLERATAPQRTMTVRITEPNLDAESLVFERIAEGGVPVTATYEEQGAAGEGRVDLLVQIPDGEQLRVRGRDRAGHPFDETFDGPAAAVLQAEVALDLVDPAAFLETTDPARRILIADRLPAGSDPVLVEYSLPAGTVPGAEEFPPRVAVAGRDDPLLPEVQVQSRRAVLKLSQVLSVVAEGVVWLTLPGTEGSGQPLTLGVLASLPPLQVRPAPSVLRVRHADDLGGPLELLIEGDRLRVEIHSGLDAVLAGVSLQSSPSLALIGPDGDVATELLAGGGLRADCLAQGQGGHYEVRDNLQRSARFTVRKLPAIERLAYHPELDVFLVPGRGAYVLPEGARVLRHERRTGGPWAPVVVEVDTGSDQASMCLIPGADAVGFFRGPDGVEEIGTDPFLIDCHELSLGRARVAAGPLGLSLAPPDGPAEPPAGHPVRGLPFEDAERLAAALGKRLPGGMEWQVAADFAVEIPEQAPPAALADDAGLSEYGVLQKFPWGSDPRKGVDQLVWFAADSGTHAIPVEDLRDASPWGVIGMAFGVREWCGDPSQYPMALGCFSRLESESGQALEGAVLEQLLEQRARGVEWGFCQTQYPSGQGDQVGLRLALDLECVKSQADR